MIPFVEGWDFVGILGEGAFGEVRLVANSAHNIAAAAKIVNLDELNEETKTSIEREIKVHRLLKHKNIIRYYSHRFHQPWNSHLIFMEYASGGELFDKLKPDVGMSESQAQNYFRQLLDGVNFMHRKGICHRDIKPENLLITDKGVLKIIDFGHASVCYSRSTGQPKQMDKVCGTPPYMAPEIWSGNGYFGTNVDVWSCGIVLIAMLSGELPWSKAVDEDPNYKLWKEGKTLKMPWTNVSIEVIQLSKKVLNFEIDKRLGLDALLKCDWLKNKKTDEAFSVHASKRLKLSESTCFSQPELPPSHDDRNDDEQGFGSPDPHMDLQFVLPQVQKFLGSSQPVSKDLITIASQTQPSQTQNGSMILKIPRITRLGLNSNLIGQNEIVETVKGYLDNYSCTKRNEGVWRFAENSNISPLVIRMSIYSATSHEPKETTKFYLVDFARSRGDSMQFRKVFRQIKKQFTKFEVKIPLGQQIMMDSSSRDTISSEQDAKQKGVNEKENFSGNSQPMLSSNEDHEAS